MSSNKEESSLSELFEYATYWDLIHIAKHSDSKDVLKDLIDFAESKDEEYFPTISGRSEIIIESIANPAFEAADLTKYYNRFKRNSKSIQLLGIASNPKTPKEILSILSESNHDAIRIRVATNINTGEIALTRLARDTAPEVRHAVTSRKVSISNYIMKILSEDKDIMVLKALLARDDVPVRLLNELAKHKNHTIRLFVLHNKRCTARIVELLSDDTSASVRSHVAIHKKASIEALEKLAKDPNDSVRNYIFHNNKFCTETMIHNYLNMKKVIEENSK